MVLERVALLNGKIFDSLSSVISFAEYTEDIIFLPKIQGKTLFTQVSLSVLSSRLNSFILYKMYQQIVLTYLGVDCRITTLASGRRGNQKRKENTTGYRGFWYVTPLQRQYTVSQQDN